MPSLPLSLMRSLPARSTCIHFNYWKQIYVKDDVKEVFDEAGVELLGVTPCKFVQNFLMSNRSEQTQTRFKTPQQVSRVEVLCPSIFKINTLWLRELRSLHKVFA